MSETHTPLFGDDGYDNMRFNTQQMDPNGQMRQMGYVYKWVYMFKRVYGLILV